MNWLWYIVSVLRTIVIIITMILWMLVYGISLLFRKHTKVSALKLRNHWLKYIAIPVLGLQIDIKGQPHNETALYIANHRSFTDPIVICRYLEAFVVAKAEVANYPVINKGAELTGVLYVKREEKSSRTAVRKMILDTLVAGYNVLVFPEGTVSTLKGTLEFRKGAFDIAFRNNIPVIPLAIEYQSVKDLWLTPNFVKQFLLKYAKPQTKVKLNFGTPISGDSPEELAVNAQSWIESQIEGMQLNWSQIDYEKFQ